LAIVLPPEVYGYDSKHDRLSMMIPELTRFAVKHGYAPVIGEGLSVETQVHVMDLARGYVAVLHFLEHADQKEVLANPYWLCENGEEFTWKEAAEVIGQALYKAGKIKDPAPRNPPTELYSELCGPKTESYMGLNCRARGVRLKTLGWQAREKGIWESYLQDELPVILKQVDRTWT
jgi:nucleoside-diphosphate-sugar epimerase